MTATLQNIATTAFVSTPVTATGMETAATVLATASLPAGALLYRITAWFPTTAGEVGGTASTIDWTLVKNTNDRSGNTTATTVLVQNSTVARTADSYSQYGDAVVDIPVEFKYGGAFSLVVDTPAAGGNGRATTVRLFLEYTLVDPDSLA